DDGVGVGGRGRPVALELRRRLARDQWDEGDVDDGFAGSHPQRASAPVASTDRRTPCPAASWSPFPTPQRHKGEEPRAWEKTDPQQAPRVMLSAIGSRPAFRSGDGSASASLDSLTWKLMVCRSPGSSS